MPSSTPPLTSSAKMLYEEGETHDGLTIWTPSNTYHRRRSGSRRRICLAITFGVLIFFLGVSAGAFLHATLFPDSESPLVRFSAFFQSENDDNATLIDLKTIDEDYSDKSGSIELEDVTTRLEGDEEKEEENEEGTESESSEEEATTRKTEDETEGDDEENARSEEIDEKKKKKKKKRIENTEDVQDADVSENGGENEDQKFTKANKECSNITWYSSRLPSTAIPTDYELTIHPNISTREVEGSVLIKILIQNDTKLLVLNAENLELRRFEVKHGEKVLRADFVQCEVMTQWAWKFSKRLKKGVTVKLLIDYKFQLKTDLQGLYLSTHVAANGDKTESAVTQFEPTFARKMLPCFDEPNFKATFQVSIIRQANHNARSNMDLHLSRELENGLIRDEFEKSIKMSTYLLAVAVLDSYGYVKRLTRNTTKAIEVRLYAPNDMLHGQSEFGLDTTIRALEFFEHYFNISYPLDKIDLLALDDFSEGAMENWGLVTFRDSALLFNAEKASVVAKEHIALIVCHEIAHQWFGNLVTMDWWNEVFLNEGFANYMEYKCVDQLFPEWNIMNRFYAENLAFSQEPDGFLRSRAIESDDNDSLLNLFDAINYHKAAAIIHMIAEMAGQKNFQTALIEYLNKYAYANAKGVDLWEIVEKHANLQGKVSIPELARAYTTQVGYPLVTFERTGNHIQVQNQTRFLFTEGEEAEKNRGSWKWPIPIYSRSKNEESSKMHWVLPDETNVGWDVTKNDWFILNTGGVGYFKVLYDLETYAQLIRQLSQNHTAISSVDRSMLLVDTYDLSRTSLLNITVYFDLVEYAEKEKNRMTWSIISKQLRMIESLIEDSDYLDLFQDFQRTLIMKLYDSLDWDAKEATPSQKKLQIEAFSVACRLRIKDCTKKAYQRYLKWISSDVRNPEHHLIALLEGIKQGGQTAWERVWKAYKSAVSPYEKSNIVGALTSTRDPQLVTRLMRYCLDGRIKPNIIPRVFSGLSLNQVARNTAWKFFKNNFSQFHKLMGKGSTLMSTSVKCLAEPLSTEEELKDLKEFLKSQKFEEDGQFKMEMTYEQIELNIQWRKLNEEQLGKWIRSWDERRRTLYRRKRHRHHGRHTARSIV